MRWATPLALAGGLALATGCVPPSPLAQQKVKFKCTGGPQDWVVPPGVTKARFHLWGAQGGIYFPGDPNAAPAGLGGRTTAKLSLTPGESIRVNVGCQGASGVPSELCEVPLGGFNGGGNGGRSFARSAGAGGGASDVRQGGPFLANRVLVAGGGGGGGAANGTFGAGGHGGGLNAKSGGDGVPGVTGGGGGTQAAAGAGGLGSPPSWNGGTGGQASGGVGGSDTPGCPIISGAGGGGGGGGFFPGGGGGGRNNVNGVGGGGGGASKGPANATFQEGVRSGHGKVKITWTP